MKKNSLKKLESPIRKTSIPESELLFSFKYFDESDPDFCPTKVKKGYTKQLSQRLKELSSWTISRFIKKQCHTMHNHKHIWSKTSKPFGFQHLNSQLQEYDGWQFALTANEHGRVHGILIDNTFFIIWLDPDHKLYPKK